MSWGGSGRGGAPPPRWQCPLSQPAGRAVPASTSEKIEKNGNFFLTSEFLHITLLQLSVNAQRVFLCEDNNVVDLFDRIGLQTN